MKKTLCVLALAILAAAGCAPKAERVALQEGTPAYALAQELAAKIPALGPERTTVLAEARGISVTAAEVLLTMRNNMGNLVEKLKELDAGQLKEIFDRGATQIAERKLLMAAATAAKTIVPPSELDQAMRSEYGRAGGEEAFLKTIKDADVSLDYVKKSVGESLVIRKFLQGIAEKGGDIGEDELRRAYAADAAGDRTASVRHILIMTQGKAEAEKAEARKRIEGLLARAKAGEDFAELAKQYSEDTYSKDSGGLIENFTHGQMVKPFEDAAFSVPVGEISGVVETDFGYHILQVVDRKKETRTFEEVRPELEARLAPEKQNTAVQDYVQGLKDKAKFRLIGL
jgi:parvulin-like peptidyl-prolyl isomerase